MSKFDAILAVKPDGNTQLKTKTKDNPISIKLEENKRIGKRSHPDFTQITAYVRKHTHEEVMRKIYKKQEFSELIEQLLMDWLETN